MSEEFPNRFSSGDFGFGAGGHRAAYRRPNTSLLGIAPARTAERPPAAARRALTEPMDREVQARAPVPREAPAPVTLEKVGDFLELDFRRIFAWLKAGLMLALVLAVLGAAAGAAYGLLAPRHYTVATDILVNPSNLQVIENDLYTQSGQADQVLNLRSKQRVLTSRNVLMRVVDQLGLAGDPDFRSAKAADPRLAALSKLQDSVTSNADDKSFVTTLLVTARSPQKAIEISDAIVEAFQKELASTDAEGASRAAASLEASLAKLREGVQDAENKVEAYRREHNLSSSNGQLVSSQTMTQLNAQIVAARARAAAAQANYDTLVADGANGSSSGPAVSDWLVVLRDNVSKARQELNSQSVLLGPRHPSIQKLKVELSTAEDQLKAEYRRIVEIAKANRDAANTELASLEGQLNHLQGDVFSDSESQVALRELERDAASKTAVYERFLARARQIGEREQIDTTNVQVISAPMPPKGRSSPPGTLLLIAFGAVAGFAFGIMLSIARGVWKDLRGPAAAPGRGPA